MSPLRMLEKMLKQSFDADCYQLAEGALPDDASEEQKQELVKVIQGAIEEYVGGLQG